jgi:hypothetical protein
MKTLQIKRRAERRAAPKPARLPAREWAMFASLEGQS